MKKLAFVFIGTTFLFTELLAGGCLTIALPALVDFVLAEGLLDGLVK